MQFLEKKKDWPNCYSFITSVRKPVGVTQEKYFIRQPPYGYVAAAKYMMAATYMKYLAAVR